MSPWKKSNPTVLRLTLHSTQKNAGLRISDFLLERLQADFARIGQAGKVSKTKIRKLFLQDCVVVDGRPVRNPSAVLQTGSAVVVLIDPETFLQETDPQDTPVELRASDILFEDEWLIAVNKPSGIPSEGTRVASRDHVYAALLRFLSHRDGVSEPYLVSHHRLDRETSGVLLFSKSEVANPGLHQIFAEHQMQKKYQAICGRGASSAKPQLPAIEKNSASFRVENRLTRISPSSKAAFWGSVSEGGALAITDFHIVARGTYGLHICAEPLTGRTHQIRVHLSELGLPICGDRVYGGNVQIRGYTVPRTMLHATSLTCRHPVTQKDLTITAPLPPDFCTCLKELKIEK